MYRKMVGMIIAMANQKGGVAKTTCAYNLGVAFANKGKKVLLIDFDSQASLTISVGIDPLDVEDNIVSALKKNGKSITECVNKLNSNLYIVTSIIDLAQIEMEMMTRASREKILDRALSSVKKEYDYIIIDCPPQLGILTINALSCADSVVIPVKTDYLAYRGLTQLEDTITEIRELINPELTNLGVIATLYEMKIKDDNEILQELQKKYKVIGVIKKLAIAKKGIYDGQSVVEQSPSSELAMEYMKIADVICESGV